MCRHNTLTVSSILGWEWKFLDWRMTSGRVKEYSSVVVEFRVPTVVGLWVRFVLFLDPVFL